MTGQGFDPAVDTTMPFDPSVPQSARVLNAWLGGKDHYAADREVAARVVERRPQVVAAACANRLFLGRAVRYMAQRHGVTQFLDIGAGLPAPDNTHVVAQRIDPRARVVYVDSDPIVMAHARALLTSGPEGACDHVHADLRDTEYVLRSAARTLDFAQPVAVFLLAVLHLVPDADAAADVVVALGRCLGAGQFGRDLAPDRRLRARGGRRCSRHL
jgi:hypothetical protein